VSVFVPPNWHSAGLALMPCPYDAFTVAVPDAAMCTVQRCGEQIGYWEGSFYIVAWHDQGAIVMTADGAAVCIRWPTSPHDVVM
jgi:hypothetical protein